MRWPFEDRLAHYDGWLATSVVVCACLIYGLAHVLALGEAAEARRELATLLAAPAPTSGGTLPAARTRLLGRTQAVRAEVRRLSTELAMPAAGRRRAGDRAADAVRLRARVSALRKRLPAKIEPPAPDDERGVRLVEMVLGRLERGGASPSRLTTLDITLGRQRLVGSALVERVAHTTITLGVVVEPKRLPALLEQLTRRTRPRLILQRMRVDGGGPERIAVQLDLLLIDLGLRDSVPLPRAVRDPEEGWSVETVSPGRSW